MGITQKRVESFGNDASLMRWIAEHLRDYIQIPAEYDEAAKQVRIESYGVLDAAVLTVVVSGIFQEISDDPMLLVNDPYVCGRPHHLTTTMVLNGMQPNFTDDWLYWLTQRVLKTPPAKACETTPKLYRVSYESKFRGKWLPTTILMGGEAVEVNGREWARWSDSSIRNIAVHDGADDVTFNFECFRK